MAQKGSYTYEWPRPMVTVDALIFCQFLDGWKFLLIKRGQEPARNHWAIPGGFLELDEELEAGAGRELFEETGLINVSLSQLHTFGQIGRDPRGRLLTVVFTGVISPAYSTVQAGDDAAEACWFPLESPPTPLAFDHALILEYALSTRPL